MSVENYRADLYAVINGVRDWDLRMREYGYTSGWEYKKFLLESELISPCVEAEYDFLTTEGWKEIASERIAWENLPENFEWRKCVIPYRSPHLKLVHAKIDELRESCDEIDLRSERRVSTFPYLRLIEKIRETLLDEDVSFRNSLISQADNEMHIAAARSLGIDPVILPVELKGVKKFVQEFCLSRGLAKPGRAKPTKTGFSYGREFGNGLVLCFSILEVRSYLFDGAAAFRINSSMNLVREEQFESTWGLPKNFPWAGLPNVSIYPAYGLKDTSPVAFYVNLSYLLLSFQFWCEAFDDYFGVAVHN